MTELNTTLLPPALRRAWELLADPPAQPDVSKGYLDLLGSERIPHDAAPKNTGAIQALWASPVGSMLWDHIQAVARRLLAAWQEPTEWLNVPPGGIALDVGCGTGDVAASLARAAGPGGLALGVDVSGPMLARAARDRAGPQVGFLRADAQRLPFRDETVDAVLSVAVLMLIPDPVAALAEMARVLRPTGRLAVMVPVPGRAAPVWRKLLPITGSYPFGNHELADILGDHGFVGVQTENLGAFQWVRGNRP